ncbi:MAG: hypothetical protein O6913_05615, partial [Chloroflexi bacterium]|nr:hypothetical protein [Chloroflexota bacterium]
MPSNDRPPVKAALFDFGGTLFSYASTVPARRRRAGELAKLIGHADVDQVFDALNNNITASFRRALSQSFYMHADVFAAGVEGAASDLGYPLSPADARAFAERTALHTLQDIEPRPGMRDTLEKLRASG